jgi:hypothetical protein
MTTDFFPSPGNYFKENLMSCALFQRSSFDFFHIFFSPALVQRYAVPLPELFGHFLCEFSPSPAIDLPSNFRLLRFWPALNRNFQLINFVSLYGRSSGGNIFE